MRVFEFECWMLHWEEWVSLSWNLSTSQKRMLAKTLDIVIGSVIAGGFLMCVNSVNSLASLLLLVFRFVYCYIIACHMCNIVKEWLCLELFVPSLFLNDVVAIYMAHFYDNWYADSIFTENKHRHLHSQPALHVVASWALFVIHLNIIVEPYTFRVIVCCCQNNNTHKSCS